MFDPKNNTTMMIHRNDTTMKKTVRINDKAEDLRDVHLARLGRRLRRMKRKLFLDAVADDPTNSGYSVRSINSSNSSINQSSSFTSLRDDDEDNGEMAFRQERMVRYNTGSNCFIFNSNSSVSSELTQSDLNEINQAVEQRQDNMDY